MVHLGCNSTSKSMQSQGRAHLGWWFLGRSLWFTSTVLIKYRRYSFYYPKCFKIFVSIYQGNYIMGPKIECQTKQKWVKSDRYLSLSILYCSFVVLLYVHSRHLQTFIYGNLKIPLCIAWNETYNEMKTSEKQENWQKKKQLQIVGTWSTAQDVEFGY